MTKTALTKPNPYPLLEPVLMSNCNFKKKKNCNTERDITKPSHSWAAVSSITSLLNLLNECGEVDLQSVAAI